MATSLINAFLFNGFIQIQWPLNLGTGSFVHQVVFVVLFFF